MESRYPYKPSERIHCTSTKVSWLFDELSDNNASDDTLSLSMSVAVNKQISEVILMLGNDTMLMVYQINACYTTYACDSAFPHINYSLHFVKSTQINNSLKEAIKRAIIK